jgi:tRNA A37 methylthiotransferase MiaB
MKHILFCQFHNVLINGNYTKNIADLYYNGIYKYKEIDGYYKQDSFFELPLWIAEIKGSLPNNYKTDLLIIENIKESINKIKKINPDYICFSVLDVNKNYIHEIIKSLPDKKFILGGYINFTSFKNYKNVSIFESIQAFIEYLDIKYRYNLDYSLFKGYKTIPRLTLSKGCLHKCKFCIVSKNLIAVSKRDIIKQIKAFKDLRFKLIYLNDKTLGQSNNYKLLPLIYKRIKKYNPDFKGFIIQTSCSMFKRQSFIDTIKNCHIYACEIGIETYNNKLLKELNKPQNVNTINNAMYQLKKLRIKIIPNIIIGLIGETKETYNNTLKFLKHFKKDIYLLNIYNLALYLNSELANDIKIKNDDDLNENKTNKSFYDKQALKDNEYFYNEVFKLGLLLLTK